MTTFTLDQIAHRKRLSECGVEELAAHQTNAKLTGGVLFARTRVRTKKDEARQRVRELFMPWVWPRPLSILTMPGATWAFEARLLKSREGAHWFRQPQRRTDTTAIECDRSIYHAAALLMPGLDQRTSVTRELPRTAFAERGLSNGFISKFYLGNVDDLMRDRTLTFDACWLDYTGPLSIERLRLIRAFYATNIRSALIVTSLKARWLRETSDSITAAGGISAWFWRAFKGEHVLHEINYQDGRSPMVQFALRKPDESLHSVVANDGGGPRTAATADRLCASAAEVQVRGALDG